MDDEPPPDDVESLFGSPAHLRLLNDFNIQAKSGCRLEVIILDPKGERHEIAGRYHPQGRNQHGFPLYSNGTRWFVRYRNMKFFRAFIN